MLIINNIMNTMKWSHKFAQEKPWAEEKEQSKQFDVEQMRKLPQERTVFQIPKSNLSYLNNKIENLNKIARKLNLEPVGYKTLNEFVRDKPGDETGLQKIQFVEIELFGNAPQIITKDGNTWKFISRILHTNEGNILKSVPGEEVPPSFRTALPKCQHCNYKRNRKDTFVLKNPDTNEYIQVGSTCLKDFLGHPSANMYASWAESLADLATSLDSMDDEYGGMGGRTEIAYDLEKFLNMIYAYIKSFGWKGRAKAQEEGMGSIATVDGTLALYWAKQEEEKRIFQDMMSKLTPDDEEMLSGAIDWARNLKDGSDSQVNQLSDYYWNLSIACSNPVVTPKTQGIVASLPVAYNKAVLSKIMPSPKTTMGNKGDLVVDCGQIEEESVYGDAVVYRIRTRDNKLAQWSGNALENYTKGSPICFEGTIIGYTRYFSTVATRLARVKVLDENEYEQRSKEISRKEEKKESPPEYQPGNKITTTVAILSKRELQTQYGETTLYKMVDNFGNTLSWFASGRGHDFEEGERLNITATVKAIKEWQGKPEIQISRAKVNSRELPENVDDKRMTKKEISSTKREIKKLEKQIKELQEQSGISDPYSLTSQVGEVTRPLIDIRQVLHSEIYSLYEQTKEKIPKGSEGHIAWDSAVLLFNADSVLEVLNAAIQKKQENLKSLEQEISNIPPEEPKMEHFTNRSEYYDAQQKYWKRQSYENQTNKLQEAMSKLTPEVLQQFQKNAKEFMARFSIYVQNLSIIQQLQEQIRELERNIDESKQLEKLYGPKIAQKLNWLKKIAEMEKLYSEILEI